MSVVFDFNDSLNDIAPASPTSLSDKKKNGKSDLDVFCVFLLTSLSRLS